MVTDSNIPNLFYATNLVNFLQIAITSPKFYCKFAVISPKKA
jgi:hypothetical protein